MPRVSKNWSYEPSKRRYVANINKEKRVLLAGVDRTKENDEQADRLYAQERAMAAVEVTGDRTAIKFALEHWLRWLKERPNPVAPNTFARCQHVVWSFTDEYGDLAGREVTPDHIERWLAKQKEMREHPTNHHQVSWGESTVHSALRTMRSAFRYCADRGLISKDPFAKPGAVGLHVGTEKSYEEKRVAVEQGEYEALMLRALTRPSKDWAILLMLMRGTGARPSELLAVRAEEWRPKDSCFFIEASDPANVGRFKTKRYKKPRLVYVPREMVPSVELLIEKYKDAPKFPANFHTIAEALKRHQPEPPPMRGVTFLFRAEESRNKRFPAEQYGPPPMTVRAFNARLDSYIRVINRDAGTEIIRPKVSAYSFRHAFVTDFIVTNNGNDLKMMAQLLGTSVVMIEKHYTHLLGKHDVLQNVLNSFEDARSKARPPE